METVNGEKIIDALFYMLVFCINVQLHNILFRFITESIYDTMILSHSDELNTHSTL